jgi:probable rRNA maturation factor
MSIDTASLSVFAKRALTSCLSYSPKCRKALRRLPDISILLISDRRMSGLHARFLSRPGPTDVITFDHGEIFISVETARKNARRFSSSTVAEIRLYIVHGLLHLCGFDDQNHLAARKMQEAQQEIFVASSG